MLRFSRPDKPLAAILLLALLVRLAALAFYPAPDFPDTHVYIKSGEALLETGLLGTWVYMPLYPLLAGLTHGGLFLKLADIALSVATVGLLHKLAFQITRNGLAARLAALGLALWPHSIFYAAARLSENLYVVLLLASFVLYYARRFLPGHIAFVLSLLVRPTAELAAPLLVLLFARRVHQMSWKTSLKQVALYGLVYAVLMTPWWIHNEAKYGHFVRLNLGDGLVWYSGNNPLNQSGGGVDTYGDVDVKPFYALHDKIAENEAMKAAAFDYIKAHPGRFMEMAAVKFIRFWQPWPHTPEYRTPFILALSALTYLPVLGLALAFLWRERQRWFTILCPPLFYGAFLVAVHVATIASLRYRYPLEPFLLLGAAGILAGPLQKRAKNLWRPSSKYE